MDCCGNYSDYRNNNNNVTGGSELNSTSGNSDDIVRNSGSVGSGGGSNGSCGPLVSPYHPYNQSNVIRYPQGNMMYYNRGNGNGSIRPLSIYDSSYEQFGYQNNVPYGYGNGNNFGDGYSPNGNRENGFYDYHHSHHLSYHAYHHNHHHAFEGCRTPPAYSYTHYHQHHHHHHHHSQQHLRDHYGLDTMYGNGANGIGCGTGGGSGIPGGMNVSAGSIGGGGGGGVGIGAGGGSGSGGSGVIMPRSNYAIRDSPYQYSSHYSGMSKEFYSAQHSMSPIIVDLATHHSSSGSIYGDYLMAPSTPYPVGPGAFSSSSNLSATGYGFSGKESKPRKLLKDKNLSKMAAMNRKLEASANMTHDSDRSATPFPNNHNISPGPMTDDHHNLRFRNDHMPSKDLWHLMNNSSNINNNWINNPYVSRPYHRKRLSSSESQVSPLLPTKRPSSQLSSNFKECQKIISEVFESDFIPSKKKRKNKIGNEDVSSSREELQNITPLPGFQQAFGSTEIGRFSEIFFNAPESPAITEPFFESEGDTLSPQLWETGDSLEGPHINLQIGATVQSVYAESYGSTDSPNSNSYFSEIRCGDY